MPDSAELLVSFISVPLSSTTLKLNPPFECSHFQMFFRCCELLIIIIIITNYFMIRTNGEKQASVEIVESGDGRCCSGCLPLCVHLIQVGLYFSFNFYYLSDHDMGKYGP